MTKKELIEQNTALQETVSELTDLVKELRQTINEQKEANEELQSTIRTLTATIDALNEKLNKNSRNSSKPPSSDGYKKPAPKSLRKSSGKKVGGQKGHTGTNLFSSQKATNTVTHMPAKCLSCPKQELCRVKATITESRRILDIDIHTNVTEHQVLKISACDISGETLVGDFPQDVSATIQYGDNLKVLVTALNTVGAVSIQRTHEILSSIFDITISTGTISNIVAKCAARLHDFGNTLRDQVTHLGLVHFDETGIRIDKKLWWVHVASNGTYTLMGLSQKRGHEGMTSCGILPDFHGIGIHDCWRPYWKFDFQHGVCCAHLLRELCGVQENHPTQKWAAEFEKLLLAMKQAKENAISRGKDSLSHSYRSKFSMRFNHILEMAREENPLQPSAKKKGRPKKGKVRALIDRLAEYKSAICLFINDFKVPFDNNQAERDLRMTKAKTKISGCFRTEEGARNYLQVMNFVSTAKKQGISCCVALKYAFAGTPELIFS